jgi:hypothetical protein
MMVVELVNCVKTHWEEMAKSWKQADKKSGGGEVEVDRARREDS